MTRTDLEAARQRLIAEHGPWINYNVHLGHGVWTMGEGLIGVAEERVARIVQAVSDLTGGLSELRILDLGAHEGGFGLELAAHGADVVAIDARKEHVAKARFAAESLGLALEARQSDVRELGADDLGQFDIVLCLGLLYHLEAQEAVGFVERLHQLTRRYLVLETQVGLSGRQTVEYDGLLLRGLRYMEDTGRPGASVKNDESFWPTRPSLLNLLMAAGFSTTLEVVNPVVPMLASYRDHVTFVAVKGTMLEMRTGPMTPRYRWPERLPKRGHPVQGRRYMLRERVERRRGGGLPAILAGKRRSQPR